MVRDTPIECRPLRRDERGAWEPLFAGYQAFYQVALGDAVVETTWGRFHDPAEPVFAAGAFEDGRLLGIVHFVFHRSTWMIGPTCYLQDLFTIPDARGRGVGRRLIEYVYAQAADAGATRVYWLTHESNAPGRLLYDRVADNAGFIQYRKTIDPRP
jgi:GNAT superfamily N-acetyltransferase